MKLTKLTKRGKIESGDVVCCGQQTCLFCFRFTSHFNMIPTHEILSITPIQSPRLSNHPSHVHETPQTYSPPPTPSPQKSTIPPQSPLLPHRMSKPLASIVSTEGGIATILLNNPPVNAFSGALAEALDKCITQVLDTDSIKAAIITGAGKVFVAGADIPQLLKLTAEGAHVTQAFIESAHALANRIEYSPKPIIAAINGDCLGGGLELALACSGRVAFNKAKLGLPECKLGVIPGMGGTQRLPRAVGAAEGVAMIMTSKPCPAVKAQKIGLVDAVVAKPDELIPTALKIANGMLSKALPKRCLSDAPVKTGAEEIKAICATHRVQLKKKNVNTIHHLAALDAIETGLLNGAKAGSTAEIQAFVKCTQHPASQALLYFFLASKSTSKIKGLDLNTLGKKNIRSAALIGSGTMSRGIALAMLFNGMKVIIKDISNEALEAAAESIIKDMQMVVKMRRMNAIMAQAVMANLTLQLDYKGFNQVDVVIEAVTENMGLKQKIFAELEKECKADCIIATNTSTLDIEEICSKCDPSTKARVIGLHFFSPAHIMPLLEIVKMKHTSPETLATSMHLSKLIKKTPVVVGNCTGFAANRIFFPYGMAGQLLLAGGLDPYTVDQVLMKFGMPMGIFRMNDSVGVDIGTHIAPVFTKAYGDRVFNTDLSELLVKAKRMGEKTQVGFYKYTVPRKPTPDLQGLAPFLQQIRTKAKEQGVPDCTKLSPQDIVEICIYPVINESCRTVQEGFSSSPADIDVISVMGYGFPAYRGGVLNYARAVGFAHVAQRLQHWAQFFPKQAGFFKPSEALLAIAKQSKQ